MDPEYFLSHEYRFRRNVAGKLNHDFMNSFKSIFKLLRTTFNHAEKRTSADWDNEYCAQNILSRFDSHHTDYVYDSTNDSRLLPYYILLVFFAGS
jgi:hypothetical protein